MQVFISVQRKRNRRQELVVQTVLDVLRRSRVNAMIINRDPAEMFVDPLPQIRESLLTCQGAIVIAFARLDIPAMTEYPDDETPVSHVSRRLSSVWIQIEAAMAFQAGLPLLIFEDEDLFQQGVINERRTSYPVVKLSTGHGPTELQLEVVSGLSGWLQDLADQ